MSLFKKIFDLPPKDVEDFIRNRVKNMWGNYDGKYDDYDLEIKWDVPYNEFYVHLEPKLQTKDWQVYSFKENKNLSLKDYFDKTFTHWHFTFQEIYGLMTGETVFGGHLSCEEIEDFGKMEYNFIYEKEYITVKYHKPTEAWIIVDWDEEKERFVLGDLPSKLVKFIKEEKVFDLDKEE